MTDLLLVVFAAECAALLYWGLLRRERLYQFPFLAGATFVGWMLPQLVGLSNNEFLPAGALNKTLLMAILCAAMCYLGYVLNRRPLQAWSWTFDDTRLLYSAAVLSVTGAYFFFAIGRLPEELTAVAQWTGIPTVYAFFAYLLSYGFAVALVAYLRRPSKPALLVILFDCLFYLDRMVIHGRRAEIVAFSVMVLLALWFQRGLVLPRTVVVAGLLGGTLLINSIGDYRAAMLSEEGPLWCDIASIDYLANLKSLFTEGGDELTNAVYNIEAVDRTHDFDFGLYHWNAMVFSYIPAQFLGQDFKDSLMIELSNPAYTEFLYDPHTGTTPTGLSDAFGSFWYFGSLKFFLIGFVMSRLYRGAQRGHLAAQVLLMVTMTPALHTITHSTHWLLKEWPQIFVFLLPALYFAKTGTVPRKASMAHFKLRAYPNNHHM